MEEQNAFLRNIDELKADIQEHDIPGIKEEMSDLGKNVFSLADAVPTIVRKNPNRF